MENVTQQTPATTGQSTQQSIPQSGVTEIPTQIPQQPIAPQDVPPPPPVN